MRRKGIRSLLGLRRRSSLPRSRQTTLTHRTRAARRRTASKLETRRRWAQRIQDYMRPVIYVAIAALVATVPLGAYRVILHVLSSPHFSLTRVDIQGLSNLDREEVLDVAGLQMGRSVMAYEPKEIEAAIATLDWVKKVQVQRVLPNGFRIGIEERVPVALAAAGQLFLVDETAEPFTRIPVEELPHLPILSFNGLERLGREELNHLGLKQIVAEALALIQEYRKLGLDQTFPLEEVSIDPVEGYRIYSRSGDVCFVLGHGPFVDKWQRLQVVLADLKAQGARVRMVRLDNEAEPGRVAVQATHLTRKAEDPRLMAPLPKGSKELLP